MQARKLILSGIVQGVGFRPFVWRLATSLGLHGKVINTGEEVEIFIEGSQAAINTFVKKLKEEKPNPAEIHSISVKRIPTHDFQQFRIAESKEGKSTLSMIPPDFAICEDCLAEIEDSSSRWYRYPFNSCAHCGPRFSAIDNVPYDRENTSMRKYPLCEQCKRDYEDPYNIRRGHIQGISCPACGPKLRLTDQKGNVIDRADPIQRAAHLLEKGRIVGIKGMGGFHIASLATRDAVVQRLRKKKNRPQKPFALMTLDLSTAKKIVRITEQARDHLVSSKRPIVLLPERETNPISNYVAPGLRKLGVMLAYTGIHYLLLKNIEDRVLIMTSGNPRGEPICKSNKCAFSKLSGKVDAFLLHDRKIFHRTDDSVVRFTDNDVTMLRRSRGYAPVWFTLSSQLDTPLIAFGADLKNVGAVARKDKAIPTQYIGDMDDLQTLTFFKRELRFLMETYEIKPSQATLIADLHPRYQSRSIAEKWAKKYDTELRTVQHHYAHTVATMIDSKIPLGANVVGISIDGVGYGKDGNIWGGEVLELDSEGWQRFGHLANVPMPGGDRATNFPVRMLIGILSKIMDDTEIKELVQERDLLQGLEYGEEELQVVLKQTKSPKVVTSSVGRTLDAISALLGICFTRHYEGEAAMKLESAAAEGRLLQGITAPVTKKERVPIIDTPHLFKSILEHENAKRSSLALSAQFAIGKALGKVAKRALKHLNTDHLTLSGGAAVNSWIVRGIKDTTSTSLHLPNRVPPGDGSTSLGQIGALAREKILEED